MDTPTNRPGQPGNGFMTVREVSDYLRVPVSTIRYWARTKKLPSYKPFGRHIYFRKHEVDQAIKGGPGSEG